MSAFARFNCAICLDWLDDTKATVVTDCGHLFHKQCIEGSLRRTLGCPSCRDRVKELKSVFFSTAPFNQTDLQEELDMAYKTINSLSRERTDLNVTQADIDAMAKTISDLSVENRRLRSNVDSLQKQLSETRSSYSGLMQRVDTLMKGARNLEKAYSESIQKRSQGQVHSTEKRSVREPTMNVATSGRVFSACPGFPEFERNLNPAPILNQTSTFVRVLKERRGIRQCSRADSQ